MKIKAQNSSSWEIWLNESLERNMELINKEVSQIKDPSSQPEELGKKMHKQI